MKLEIADFRKRKFGLTVHDRQRSESGYFHSTVVWRAGDLETLQSRLDGAIGNKAGYGTLAAAQGVERETRALLDAGHVHSFEGAFSSVGIRVRFQLYKEAENGYPVQWCHPRIEVGDEAREILAGARILEALARKCESTYLGRMDTPERAIAMLCGLAPTYRVNYIGGCSVVTSYPAPAKKRKEGFLFVDKAP